MTRITVRVRVLCLAFILLWVGFLPLQAGAASLMVDIIDVGQGDAILLHDGAGSAVLIDAGNSFLNAGPRVAAHLKARGIDRLNAAVITHPHVDHYGGLTHLLDRVKIDEVLYGTRITGPMYLDLEKAIKAHGVGYRHVKAGDRLPLPAPIEACVVQAGPEELPAGWEITESCSLAEEENTGLDLNMFSVVVRASLGKRSLLFTGDAPAPLESQMVTTNVALDVDILKVSHHGSRHSSAPDFLKAVSPSQALISCGKGNDYGHPHPDAMTRLKSQGALIRRTDQEGTIAVSTDGDTLSVQALGFSDPAWRIAERTRIYEALLY